MRNSSKILGAAGGLALVLALSMVAPASARRDSFPVSPSGARCVNFQGVRAESYYRVAEWVNYCDQSYDVVFTVKGGYSDSREHTRSISAARDGTPGKLGYPLTSKDESISGWYVEW